MHDRSDRGTASLEGRAEATPHRIPWLVAETNGQGRVRLDEDRTTVGRAARCQLVLADPFVSEQHFTLGWEQGELVLRDLDSRNGTFVNGLRVAVSRIGPGVAIQVGRTRLRCSPLPDAPGRILAGRSAQLQDLMVLLARYAELDAPVLIEGESGTGKELAARALHEGGPRRQGPFIAINCAAFSPELVDSELFGHERGAFTGAIERKRGAFELAHRGTLFLDELGELPLAQQAKLLRVLERSEFRRVGGEEVTRCDVRVVAATNVDLDEAVDDGDFRADLYHRLAVLEVRMPPLRSRTEDIVDLAERFLSELAPQLGPRTLTTGALVRLTAHPWPGNVRELRNVLYRAAACSSGTQIAPSDIQLKPWRVQDRPPAPVDDERNQRVREVLDRHAGNVSAAARDLGIARSTLRSWLARSAWPGHPLPPSERSQ